MAFARLQRDARVSQVAGQKQGLVIDQRLVDDDRLQLGRPVHAVLGMRLKIAVRRLFDVLHAVEGGRRPFADAVQEIEDVVDVLAFLIEVARVEPLLNAAGRLRFGRDAVDREHALDVPVDVVAGQLDLQVRQPVGGNPFAQRFGQSVVDARLDVAVGQRIDGSHQVVQRQSLLRIAQRVLIEKLARELLVEVYGKIVAHVLRRQRVVAVLVVNSPVSIVQGGVERAGSHQLRKRGHLFFQAELPGQRLAQMIVFARKLVDDVDRMPVVGVQVAQFDNFLGESLDGRFGLVGFQGVCGPGPNVADRHAAESGGFLAVAAFDSDVHIEQRKVLNGATAELQRGPKSNRLAGTRRFQDLDIGRL